MKNHCLLFLLVLLCAKQAHAQICNQTLQIRVLDQETKEPIVGAHLSCQKHYVAANESGEAIFKGLCPDSLLVIVSSVGYLVKEIRLAALTKNAICLLTKSTTFLQEISIEDEELINENLQQSLDTQYADSKFILKNNSITFINSLEKIAGINAINTGVGIAKPMIRGMSFNRVVVNEQGIKQQGQQWGADHGLEIDPFSVANVEIIKGAASVLYGSDAIGGVINILPAKAPKINTLSGEALSTYKSNNDLIGGSVMLEGNRNDKMFRLRMSFQDFADYRVPTDRFSYNRYVLPIYQNTLKNTAGQERNIQLMTGIHRPWGAIHLTISNFNQKMGLFAGAMGIPRAYQLSPDDARNIDTPRQIINHFKIIINKTIFIGKNGSFWKSDLGYQLNARKEESPPHAHGRPLDLSFGNLALSLDLQTLSFNSHLHQQHQQAHTIYGISAEHLTNQRSGFEFLIPDYQSFTSGLFVYHERKLSTTLTANSGLRYDIARQTTNQYTDIFYQTLYGTSARAKALAKNYHNLSGSLGIGYQPDSVWHLKFNIGSAFRMPNIAELAANGVHHGTFRHEVGQADLQIERGYQADIALSIRKKMWRLSISPFFNYFTNYLYLRPMAEFSLLPEGGQLFKYAQSQVVMSGGEVNFNIEFLPNTHFNSIAAYTYQQNLDTGLPLPFAPPFMTTNEISYQVDKLLFFRNLYFSTEIKNVAAQHRTDRNEQITAGYYLLNIGSGFETVIGKQKLSFFFQIRNLTNQLYFNHLSRYRWLNLPEQGINYALSVKIPFGIID